MLLNFLWAVCFATTAPASFPFPVPMLAYPSSRRESHDWVLSQSPSCPLQSPHSPWTTTETHPRSYSVISFTNERAASYDFVHDSQTLRSTARSSISYLLVPPTCPLNTKQVKAALMRGERERERPGPFNPCEFLCCVEYGTLMTLTTSQDPWINFPSFPTPLTSSLRRKASDLGTKLKPGG